jgi:hypothetical protein
LNCARQSIEKRSIAPGFAFGERGTLVVGAPFSMRWQSGVNGYVPVFPMPLPSFFCSPVK